MQTWWERDPADRTWDRWKQTSEGADGNTGTCLPLPVIPQQWWEQALHLPNWVQAACQVLFAALPTVLVPPPSRPRSLLECSVLLCLLVFLDSPTVQPKGRVWGWTHLVLLWGCYRVVARHTHGDLAGLLPSSAETELESPAYISPSDRIHFLAQELAPHASRALQYVQRLQGTSNFATISIRENLSYFPSPWSPSYMQTTTQTS